MSVPFADLSAGDCMQQVQLRCSACCTAESYHQAAASGSMLPSADARQPLCYSAPSIMAAGGLFSFSTTLAVSAAWPLH